MPKPKSSEGTFGGMRLGTKVSKDGRTIESLTLGVSTPKVVTKKAKRK